MRQKNLKKCKKLNWNFQRGGELLEKIPSVGEVWIFSGTTHYAIAIAKTRSKYRHGHDTQNILIDIIFLIFLILRKLKNALLHALVKFVCEAMDIFSQTRLLNFKCRQQRNVITTSANKCCGLPYSADTVSQLITPFFHH